MLRSGRFIQLAGTLHCGPILESIPIGRERASGRQGSEAQAPANMRTHINIGGSKAITGDIRVACNRLFQCVYNRIVIAVADHALFVRGDFEAKCMVGKSRLHRAGRENSQRKKSARSSG